MWFLSSRVKKKEKKALETNGPDTNELVLVTSKESLTIRRPSQRDGLRIVRLFANIGKLGLEFIDHRLGFQVPDLDARRGGSAEPVTVGREDQGIDNVITLALQRIQVLALIQIPEHGNAVTSTRGAERTIRRDSDCVDVASVSNVVRAQLALGEFPDLTSLSGGESYR